MKFLRNILSHGLLIVFLAALGLAYVYRAQLFPENIHSKIDSYVDYALDWAGVIPKEKHSVPAAVDTVVEVEQISNAVDEIKAEQATDAGEKPTAMNMMEQATESEEHKEEHSATEVHLMPVPENNDENMHEHERTEQENENSDDTEIADIDKIAAATAQAELLNQARLAFHNGKPEKSTDLYKELSELNPDDPDVYGEMGNVFYSQGKWKQAGIAFYEAASVLLTQGKTEQVSYLYRVIQGLDPQSAEKLRSKFH